MTSEMNVRLLGKDEDLLPLCEVLLELRPQYQLSTLEAQIRKQQAAGYQLAFVERDGQVLAVAGFVVAEKLAWQKHLYVDDLVTRSSDRSSGAGHALLTWLKNHARQQDCQQLHLDSGVQRFAAHRFYLREGLIINSHHFAIPDLDSAS